MPACGPGPGAGPTTSPLHAHNGDDCPRIVSADRADGSPCSSFGPERHFGRCLRTPRVDREDQRRLVHFPHALLRRAGRIKRPAQTRSGRSPPLSRFLSPHGPAALGRVGPATTTDTGVVAFTRSHDTSLTLRRLPPAQPANAGQPTHGCHGGGHRTVASSPGTLPDPGSPRRERGGITGRRARGTCRERGGRWADTSATARNAHAASGPFGGIGGSPGHRRHRAAGSLRRGRGRLSARSRGERGRVGRCRVMKGGRLRTALRPPPSNGPLPRGPVSGGPGSRGPGSGDPLSRDRASGGPPRP